MVATDIIRERKSEGNCGRNLLSGEVFLFSSVIALEKKDKCVLDWVSSIGKLKKRRNNQTNTSTESNPLSHSRDWVQTWIQFPFLHLCVHVVN